MPVVWLTCTYVPPRSAVNEPWTLKNKGKKYRLPERVAIIAQPRKTHPSTDRPASEIGHPPRAALYGHPPRRGGSAPAKKAAPPPPPAAKPPPPPPPAAEPAPSSDPSATTTTSSAPTGTTSTTGRRSDDQRLDGSGDVQLVRQQRRRQLRVDAGAELHGEAARWTERRETLLSVARGRRAEVLSRRLREDGQRKPTDHPEDVQSGETRPTRTNGGSDGGLSRQPERMTRQWDVTGHVTRQSPAGPV